MSDRLTRDGNRGGQDGVNRTGRAQLPLLDRLIDTAPEETSDLEKRLATDANDHEARFELAAALAGRGAWEAASDHLLKIIEVDRAWNDEAARKQLITIFEAAGPGSDVARGGRRRLSAILFS